MNQILIVGHPLSGYERVEKALVDSGMCLGRPTLQEQLLPSEVDAILCKTRGIGPLTSTNVRSLHSVDQLKVDPVWRDLVLDLIRGNLETPFWGWSDPLAVYLLEFWKSNLPDLQFVLVYGHPRGVLDGAWGSNAEERDSGSVVDAVNDGLCHWHYFNAALLDFFYCNRERCLLVHSDQVAHEEVALFKEINSHWLYHQRQNDALGASIDNNLTSDSVSPYVTVKSTDQGQLDIRSTASIATDSLNAAVFLATAVVMENAEREIRLYEEMQAVATLPFSDPLDGQPGAIEAWRELNILSEERQCFLSELNQLKERLGGLESDRSSAMASRCRATDENDFLLSQIFSVQEELETNIMEQQNGRRRIAELEKLYAESEKRVGPLQQQVEQLTKKLRTVAVKRKQKLGAAQRVRDGLAYKVGSKIIKDSQTVWKFVFLPFSVWSLIREYQRNNQEDANNALPLAAYDDYGKALKVQTHLSYKLGTAWLECVQAPWFWFAMPGVLLAKYLQFRREKKTNRGIIK